MTRRYVYVLFGPAFLSLRACLDDELDRVRRPCSPVSPFVRQRALELGPALDDRGRWVSAGVAETWEDPSGYPQSLIRIPLAEGQ